MVYAPIFMIRVALDRQTAFIPVISPWIPVFCTVVALPEGEAVREHRDQPGSVYHRRGSAGATRPWGWHRPSAKTGGAARSWGARRIIFAQAIELQMILL